MRLRNLAPGLADAAGALAVAAYTLRIAILSTRLQWDLRVYLDAARATLAGLDPYLSASLTAVSGRPAQLSFLYPPIALLPFLALSRLPLPVAVGLWMALKLALLAWMVVLWKRVFTPWAPWAVLALVFVFGSNAAALWDLRSGNVAILESALIVTGLACWVRGQRVVFAALVVASALFKLVPAVFLMLLLVPVGVAPARTRLLAFALVALVLLALVPNHFGPWAGGTGWHEAALGPFPTGETNPSWFAFLVDRAGSLGTGAYAGWAIGGVLLLALFIPTLRRVALAGDACALGVAAIVLDLLAHPRPMAYGWVLGGGALVALIGRIAPGLFARLGLALLVSAQGLLWALQIPWSGPLAAYAPPLVLLALALLAAFAPTSGVSQWGLAGADGTQPTFEADR